MITRDVGILSKAACKAVVDRVPSVQAWDA